jgi:hypothetical protein
MLENRKTNVSRNNITGDIHHIETLIFLLLFSVEFDINMEL